MIIKEMDLLYFIFTEASCLDGQVDIGILLLLPQ
jgi:hypothetical protein